MLERYYIRPDTIDRIQASWIAGGIERYVEWLTEHRYAARNVFRRVPILRRFGDVARARGAATREDLPRHVDAFVAGWVQERGQHCRSDRARRKVADEARNPIEQMLALVVPGFVGRGRARGPREPFAGQAGAFFEYLRSERGLRDASILLYRHHLAQFDAYLQTIGLVELTALSPAILGAFVVESGRRFGRTSMRSLCGILRVFLRYLHREHLLPKDFSASVESPRAYRLATIPRAITWDEVRRMLEAVDRRSTTGKRDYAILLLLVTYGLRAREVAALTLDDLDWKSGSAADSRAQGRPFDRVSVVADRRRRARGVPAAWPPPGDGPTHLFSSPRSARPPDDRGGLQPRLPLSAPGRHRRRPARLAHAAPHLCAAPGRRRGALQSHRRLRRPPRGGIHRDLLSARGWDVELSARLDDVARTLLGARPPPSDGPFACSDFQLVLHCWGMEPSNVWISAVTSVAERADLPPTQYGHGPPYAPAEAVAALMRSFIGQGQRGVLVP